MLRHTHHTNLRGECETEEKHRAQPDAIEHGITATVGMKHKKTVLFVSKKTDSIVGGNSRLKAGCVTQSNNTFFLFFEASSNKEEEEKTKQSTGGS